MLLSAKFPTLTLTQYITVESLDAFFFIDQGVIGLKQASNSYTNCTPKIWGQ